MPTTKLVPMSPAQVENRAIEFVLAHERSIGREPLDTRQGPNARVDVESLDPATDDLHLIEVKAYGGTGRGEELWLEPGQVQALEGAEHAHLYIVTQVRSEDAAALRILDLSGPLLQEHLAAKKLKQYYTVPLRTSTHDLLTSEASEPPELAGLDFLQTVLEAVTVLHARGDHGIQYWAMMAPNGIHVRVFVGRREHMQGENPGAWPDRHVVFTSVSNGREAVRQLGDVVLPAWWTAEMVADAVLAALPPAVPAADDPAYVAELVQLLARSRADGKPPLTVNEY